jgi:2-polyprenyl-3-methyl-5-hydroxy-6-metoxy-1,4-benzoquinol methylase
MDADGRKTLQDHWESVHVGGIRMNLPTSLLVSTLNFKRLLRANVTRPGMKVLEIGFAPGKHLAWVAKALCADVSGIDYSEVGMQTAAVLFKTLQLKADLRCEDVFETTFENSHFDLVYSLGLIEHFDDPRTIVQKHLELVAPGGCALLVVPNYGGIYGRLQKHFDCENLAIHNVDIMCQKALKDLVPAGFPAHIETYPFGRISPWLVNWDRRWSPAISRSINIVVNGIGLIMPFDIHQFSPWIVLQVIREPIRS